MHAEGASQDLTSKLLQGTALRESAARSHRNPTFRQTVACSVWLQACSPGAAMHGPSQLSGLAFLDTHTGACAAVQLAAAPSAGGGHCEPQGGAHFCPDRALVAVHQSRARMLVSVFDL